MSREFALPGTRSQYAPDRRVDIQHYRLELSFDLHAKRLHGRCVITLTPIAAGQRWLELDAAELEIRDVRGREHALEFTVDGRTLRIDLEQPAVVGRSLEHAIAYTTLPRRGLHFVGPDEHYPSKPRQVWSQGQDRDSRFWFPCFDSPHEKATSEVIVTVPERWFALSNGRLIADEVTSSGRRLHWRQDIPHSCYLIMLAAGEFAELRERWRDIDVLYYVQPGREQDCRRALARTPEMLELFSERFGVAYPFDKYAQVFVADFIFGGMENTSATTLTDVVLMDERAALDYRIDDLVAHELAHQWFGDLVTCRDWGQGWLNEGFATYSEYIWREHAEGADAADMELDDWATNYLGEDKARYRRRVATKIYDEPIDIFDRHLYDKGGRILHMLRRILGDDGFWRSIAHYLRKHRGGAVETRDLVRAIEDATGRVMDWYFDQWVLDGAGHPELELTYGWDAERGLARVSAKQTQDTSKHGTPVFRLPTRLRFHVDGVDRDVDVELGEREQVFHVPLPVEPTQAIFDPGKQLLAEVKFDKPPALWRAELASASAAIDRVDAARALAKLGGREAEATLIAALRDPFWGVVRAAALGLGALRSAPARQALCDAISTTAHPKARRGIVEALGCFRHDEAAADALIRVIEAGDASYFVEAEACLALGRTRSRRAGAVLRSALDRDSFLDVIRQHVYRGLAEARDADALGALLAASEYGRVSHGRRAAIAALAALVRGRRDREALDARERLESYLRDPDYRVQAAAIEALAALGEDEALAPLRALVDREIDGRLRRRAREVIRDIGDGRAHTEQLETLRADLEQLRAEAVRLRERLDRADVVSGPKPAAPRTRRRAGANGARLEGAGAARRAPRPRTDGGEAVTPTPAVKRVRRRGGGKKAPKTP
jgi:aminopeptidase N